MDAKLSRLVGDDSDRNVGPSWLPNWIRDFFSDFGELAYHPLDDGALGHNEHDYSQGADFWRGAYDLYKTYGFNLLRVLSTQRDFLEPYYKRQVEADLTPANMRDDFSADATNVTVGLQTPTGNLIYTLGTLAALMTISDRIPYVHFDVDFLRKLGMQDGADFVTYAGCLADVENSREFEVVTRLEQFREASLGTAGG